MTRHRIVQVLLVALASLASLAAPTLRAQCAPAVQRLIVERKFDQAQTELEAQLKRVPGDAAAMNCMGRLLLEQDESSHAVEWLEKAVAANGKSAQHHLWLGIALRTEGGKAAMLRAPGFVSRMKAELEQALALDPTLVDARFALLQFYVGAPAIMGGSMPKAREQVAEMLKLNPMRGHIGAGVVAEQEKDYAAAEKEFLAAIAVRPDSDVTYSAAGAFYRRRERWADAIGMYEKQLKTMPSDATPTKVSNAHYFLGLAHEKSGHRDTAKAEYQAAIAANPKNEDAKKALASSKDD
jgi:tetratricopeptide (TPR) repeat protein